MIGIYEISNTLTGHRYVGRSVRLAKRLREHLGLLRAGQHFNPRLQKAFSKYGEHAFAFRPLIVCRREDLTFYEALLIAGLGADKRATGYNLTLANGETFTHTAEARAKIAAFQKVYQADNVYERTPEIRERIRSALTGRVGGNLGKKFAPEVAARMGRKPGGVGPWAGKTRSQETRDKIAATLKRRHEAGELTSNLTPERIALAHTPDVFERRVAAIKATHNTDEVRTATSKRTKAHWQDEAYRAKTLAARKDK